MDIAKKEEVKAVVNGAANVYVSSVDEKGYPNIKAMFARKSDNMKYHYMSTNYSSKRTKQFLANDKCSIYYCDEKSYKGVMLTGHMEVCTDYDTKSMLWEEGDVIYYPKGIEDPDYCVYRFVADRGNYYHGLSNIDFEIDELS